MATETTTLYDVLGGPDAIAAVVDEFYKRVLTDRRINHYFKHLDIVKQHNHQKAFIGMVLGGPNHYQGRSMREAHAGLKLSTSDFNAVAEHLVAVLEQLKVPQVHIDTVMSKIAALEHDIVGN